ncbi:hypothetical protein [Massilia sp. ST3]|uniref:hypothetical protein n=1 Tax=Massilia sp. ST3 TaxID=2824903 RepID=UPI001B84021C|nr:hypothetical protein [Massilia sp. ST3]MBQ5948553.1 hypothetical protein [Massilia sp. ST3]
MERRHEDAITSRLEEILTRGAAFISWNELYLWYGQKRLAVGSYRDLSNRWDELVESMEAQSSTGWSKGTQELGHLVFVQSPMNVTPGIFLFGSNMAQPVYSPE